MVKVRLRAGFTSLVTGLSSASHRRRDRVIVAASTECYPELPMMDALAKLLDLEYSSVELTIKESNRELTPSGVLADLDQAIDTCRNTRRLQICSYDVDIDVACPEYYEQFAAICKLAKATKVVSVTVPAGELGTPFNEEVERLRKLVDLATLEGVVVSIRTQIDRLSEDPDTVSVLCDNVEGLGLSFDPSVYICGNFAGRDYDKLLKYVSHVYMRDTSKEEFQVRIGKGEVDYGRLVGALRNLRYNRALSVHVRPLPDTDHMSEMRKIRLLLESLL